MKKKIIIFASAIIGIVLGSILAAAIPKIVTLIIFLEVCLGFGCGFFYCKELKQEEKTQLEEEIANLKGAVKDISERKVRITTKKKVDSKK